MPKTFKTMLFFLLLIFSLGACSKKSAPASNPSPAAAPQQAAESPVPAAPAQAPSPAGLDGSWNGDSGKDLPVSFTVGNNQLSDIYVSYRVQKEGGCTSFASFTSDNKATIQGKSFTATGKKDQMNDHVEFTMNGTFTSDSEASGTLKWTGKSNLCGDIDVQANWTAKKGEIPSSED